MSEEQSEQIGALQDVIERARETLERFIQRGMDRRPAEMAEAVRSVVAERLDKT